MAEAGTRPTLWGRLPTAVRAVVSGLAIGLVGANVWSLLLIGLGPLPACILELAFFAAYLWWAGGHGVPRSTQVARSRAFRARRLTPAGWVFGVAAAVAFAVTVHAAIVILFRLIPFPAARFHQGYDLSYIPSPALRWAVVVISAMSAGICEETGFRGYMQQPLEARFGVIRAVLTSAVFFTVFHLNKGWAGVGMVPIIFGAGLLLGALAWASQSLIPVMIGHTLMDIGLFAYWWTQITGTFAVRPIGETGIDTAFLIALAVFAVALAICLTCIGRLRTIAR